MVSIAFYGGLPGGISTPIVQESGEITKDRDNTIFQPYCYNRGNKEEMADGREPGYQEKYLKEEAKEESKEEKRNKDWWKIGMLLLCLMGTTGGILWWYEGVVHPYYIGLIAVGGRLSGSGMSNAIECWGSFPGCRPFTNYFSYNTNRTVYCNNDTATLLTAYQREVTHIYRTSCVDSDHCQEYECKSVNVTYNGTRITIGNGGENTSEYWGFKWLECNQTENARTLLLPQEEMIRTNNSTWIPKGCNETWAQVKHCPVDLLYGIHPIRLCVQPPFFLFNNETAKATLSNCGPMIFLGILEDSKTVVRNASNNTCTVERKDVSRPDYHGNYQVPIFYNCSFNNVSNCPDQRYMSIIMYENNNVQYLLCNNGSNNHYNCVVQTFGVIGQAHIMLPRINKRINTQKFTNYNCSVNNKTELDRWKLVKTSGITPLPISSEANTGLVRHKRDFGVSALVAAIVAATAIAASATMSYIALTEAQQLKDVANHTFEVENNTITSVELIEKQMHILYAMILQTHADVQLLKEKQQIEETFNLIGCVEKSHVFCHTGHPWNSSWGHLNDSAQWDDWVEKMEGLNQDILTTLHAARNNLAQAMITFNTPDSIAQFGKNLWGHIANWIPGLGASIIKYIVLLLIIYVVLTSTPKIGRNLLTTISGAGTFAARYLRNRFHHRRAWRDDTWDQGQPNLHLAGVIVGSENKYCKQRGFRNNWNGGSEEYGKRLKNYKNATKGFGENFTTPEIKRGIIPLGQTTDTTRKSAGENPQGSVDLEIQNDGGNIYDCCIKAQEGTLAIPCCGFPLWLFWGLLIITGRLLGYGLRGIAQIIHALGKGLMLVCGLIRKTCDYIGKALNPSTSHVSMPQYI
nr:envelope protein [Equine infectious anemia virus]